MAHLQCQQCDKSYNRPSLLAQHMRTHTGERPFKCDQCESSFTRKAHLDSHKRCHTGERAFVCTECGKGVHTKQHLERHMNMHRKAHKCEECGESFRMAIQLRRHIIRHSLVCDCGQNFRTPSMLARHKREDKEYKCPHCGSISPCPTLLLIHQKQHREQREKDKQDKIEAVKEEAKMRPLPLPPVQREQGDDIDPDLLLPPSKRRRPRPTGKTTIGLLTGSHYAKRTIPCPVEGCEHRANRKYDMARHIASAHPGHLLKDLDDDEDDDEDELDQASMDAVRVAAEATAGTDVESHTASPDQTLDPTPESTFSADTLTLKTED